MSWGAENTQYHAGLWQHINSQNCTSKSVILSKNFEKRTFKAVLFNIFFFFFNKKHHSEANLTASMSQRHFPCSHLKFVTCAFNMGENAVLRKPLVP